MIRATQTGTMVVLREYGSLEEYSFSHTDVYDVGPFEDTKKMPNGTMLGRFTVRTKSGRPFKAFGSTQDYNDVIKIILKNICGAK